MKHSMIKCIPNFLSLQPNMLKTFLSICALLFYVALVGCGTQGPLYIPEQRYPQKAQDKAPKTPDVKPAEQTTNQ